MNLIDAIEITESEIRDLAMQLEATEALASRLSADLHVKQRQLVRLMLELEHETEPASP